MAVLTLPPNSKVEPGKTHSAPPGAGEVRRFVVYRWSPDDERNPRTDTFEVDLDDCGPMVLDALIKIKNEMDSTLTFRRSCREGVCGSCSMNIGGVNSLACTSPIRDLKGDVKVYPLPHLPVVKDLVPDMTQFYAQYASIKPWMRAVTPPRRTGNGSSPRTTGIGWMGSTNASSARVAPRAARATGGTANVISGLPPCSRRTGGSRTAGDEYTGERLDELEDPFRLYRCHTIMNCTRACPKGLNPAKAIAEVKKMMVVRQL